MINKERIQNRLKELGYKQSDDKGDRWEKKRGSDDLSVSFSKDSVDINYVCHPYKEGWIFSASKTTTGAIRAINENG